MKKSYALFALVAIASLAANSACVNIGARGFKGTFNGKTSITNVEFFSCKNIGESAFEDSFIGCTGLRTVRFNECTNVAESAFASSFKECSALESVEFDNLETVGIGSFSYAFSDGCRNVAIELPSAKTIGVGAFTGCTSITSFVANACEELEGYTPSDRNFLYGCHKLRFVSMESFRSFSYDFFGESLTNLESVSVGFTTNELDSVAEYPWGLATNTLVICKGGNEIRVPSANWNVVSKTEGVELYGTPSYIGDPNMPHGWFVGFTYNGTYGVAYAYNTYYNDDEITLTDYSLAVEIVISCKRIR